MICLQHIEDLLAKQADGKWLTIFVRQNNVQTEYINTQEPAH